MNDYTLTITLEESKKLFLTKVFTGDDSDEAMEKAFAYMDTHHPEIDDCGYVVSWDGNCDCDCGDMCDSLFCECDIECQCA